MAGTGGGHDATRGPGLEALTNAAWFTGIVFAVLLGITALSGFDPGLGMLLLTAVTGAVLLVLLGLRGRARRRAPRTDAEHPNL
jgi:UPF0716 family protein affecting phage T7 exclusion